ncbi:MAG: putative bifunctional diguanylate cyclase/phosphodiesterase [Candidatus Baltobacteraceae bacterium]
MSLTGEAAYKEWLEKNVTATILIYSGLVVVLLPAFHYILGTIPGVPPDSLGLRLFAAGWSAAIALAMLLFPKLRARANAMQFINVLPTVLVIAVLTVNSGNHYIYIAASLLVIVGAQQAFYRTSDLAITMSIAFFFQAFYSALAGIFYTRLNLTALAIYASAYVIAFVPAALRIRIQQDELRSRLEAQRIKIELEEREAALRTSQERLADVQAITSLGNWTRDLRTAEMSWSPELYRIFDLPSSAPSEVTDGLYETSIHPEDLDHVHAEIEASEATGLPFSADHRIILRDGSIRWVHLRGKYEYGLDGIPLRRVGAVLDITRRKEAEESLSRLARYDTLTGLPNRVALQQRLSEALAQAEATGQSCALMFLDLDRFKDINDTLGHSTGDVLLRAVGERFAMMLRPDALLARWGGDEFVVLLQNVRDNDDAARVARRLTSTVTEPFYIENYELVVSVSVGISMYPWDAHDETVLIRNADTAMYRAKEQTAQRYAFFEPEMHAEASSRHQIQNELRKAISGGNLILFYQPIVETGTGKVIGAEALLRWLQPGGEIRMPDEFISIAEDSGLIIPIGTWALQAACSQIRKWQEKGMNLVVSVNISARQFAHPEFINTLAMVLRQTHIDPSLLDIEVTESALMSDVDTVLHIVREIKAMGVHLTIDDFGTGYSSFAYLKKFALNSLKLDSTFVSGIENAADRAIARSIITIAHTLGMSVTGEGVESRSQFDILDDLRCDQLQGFYISHAVPVSDFERYYHALANGTAVDRPTREEHKVVDLTERIPLRRRISG